ncbi:M48 family metallopeptidase [Sphingoaurantiacus capsulatus]|uniref:M48 family metallopeptidase n=1 Tax=Sphingoaurantiacus capsulatus TaxID=1771310 RepID=A0ABV7XC51_9SPHN
MRKLGLGLAAAALCAAVPVMAQETAPAFDAEAATQAYMATLSGAARAKSDAYFEGGYWLILWGAVVSIVTNLIFLRLGWSARLSAWAGRRTQRPFLRSLLWAAPYILIISLMTLPWSWYQEYYREHQYGLSNQSFGAWFSEGTMGLAISIVVMSLLIGGLLALVRRYRENWWGIGAAATLVFVAILLMVAPVSIAPLFNKYSPMEAGPLREQILSMARANTVPADNVYVVDQSRQTTRISANVSGLGPTIRISLNDNLLNQGTPAEVRAVMGHELGHYVLNHSFSLLLGFGVIILLAYLSVAKLVPVLLRKWGGRWGVTEVTDPAAVPAAFIVLAVYFMLATPFTNSLTRMHEQEADVFGLAAARAPDGFAKVAMKLSTYRKIEPSTWEEIIFFDHPSGHTRVSTAMKWKAENIGAADIE